VEMEGDGVQRIVDAAYLMSPHRPGYDPSWEASEMPGRLFHPEYRGRFRFGAVTLRPGMNMDQVRAALEAVLEDAGEASAGASA